MCDAVAASGSLPLVTARWTHFATPIVAMLLLSACAGDEGRPAAGATGGAGAGGAAGVAGPSVSGAANAGAGAGGGGGSDDSGASGASGASMGGMGAKGAAGTSGAAGASGAGGAGASGAGGAGAGDGGAGSGGQSGTGTAGDAGAAGSAGGPPGEPRIVLVAGTGMGGDGSLATEAAVQNPYGAVVDPMTGDVYIAEVDTGKIRHIDADGVITTVVGPGAPGAPGNIVLNQPHDLLFQPGTRILFIADTMNGNVYRMDANTGEVATFAGSGAPFPGETRVYCLGFSPSGTDLYFTAPNDIRVIDLEAMSEKPAIAYPAARVIALDSKGTLYAVKNRPNGDSLQVVDAQGSVTDMPATLNVVSDPKHLAIDLEDNVIIADTELFLLRKYDVANDTLTTLVGNGVAGTGMLGGDPTLAELRRPHGTFVDLTGVIYISDSENDRVLKIER